MATNVFQLSAVTQFTVSTVGLIIICRPFQETTVERFWRLKKLLMKNDNIFPFNNENAGKGMIHRAKPLCTAYCTWENQCPSLPLCQLEWSGLRNQKHTASDNKAPQLSHCTGIGANIVMASQIYKLPPSVIGTAAAWCHHWKGTIRLRWDGFSCGVT